MRSWPPTGIAGVALGLVVALATVSGTAFAYFSTTGAGSASAGVSKLPTPTIVAATPAAGGTVALSWEATTPPGSGAVTYTVTRDGGNPSGTCPSSSSPAPVTSCVDSGLELGTHSYVVSARWRSWNSSSSTSTAKITVGPVTHLSLKAASASPTAGAADNLTITAQDAGNNTVTTYTGPHSLTFSGAPAGPDGTNPTVSNSSGTDVTFGSATAIAFTAGVATVSSSKNGAMKLYKSGATSIEVSDGTFSATVSVTVAAAATADFTLAAASTTPVAGAADNLTITAIDPYDNTATSYTGSHSLTFSGASASPEGTNPTVSNSSGTAINFGAATAIGFTAGVASVTGGANGAMKLYKSGATDIDVSDGSISGSADLTVTVAPASTSKIAFVPATTTPTAGTADNLTITVSDAYGNPAPTYTGSHSLTFSGAVAGPDGTNPTVSNSSGTDVAFGSATAIGFTAGVASVSGGANGAMKLYKNAAASIKVSEGTYTSAAVSVTAAAATASNFTLVAASTTPVAGAADNLTITAFDPYGNTATSYAGSQELTFSGSSASPSGTLPTVSDSSAVAIAFGSPTAIAFTAGVAKVSSTKNGVMKLSRAGATTVAVSDDSISSPSVSVTVSPGTAARWAFSNVSISAGVLGSTCLFTCSVTGLGNSGTVVAKVNVTDSLGNTVNAVGTGHAVKITSSGGTIAGTPLTISSTGAAESTTQFTYTAKSAGTFSDTITAATSTGTAYTSATFTTSR